MKRTKNETRGFLRVDALRTKDLHGFDAFHRRHRTVDASHKVAGIKKLFLNNVQVAGPVRNGIRDFGREKYEPEWDLHGPEKYETEWNESIDSINVPLRKNDALLVVFHLVDSFK